jgi:hypothetical protein
MFLVLLSCLFAISYAKVLLWGAVNGANFGGAIFATDLTTNKTTQLSFTTGLRSFGVTNQYLVWSYYNSTSQKSYLGRATRINGGGNNGIYFENIQTQFISLQYSVQTMGRIAPSESNDNIYYSSGTGELTRLDVKTGKQTILGSYRGNGGGGFNGGLIVTKNEKTAYFGADQGIF